MAIITMTTTREATHLRRAAASLLELRLIDRHNDARGATIGMFAPLVLPENTECLGHGLLDTLRGNPLRMRDALW
jgi:hypothetical protein